MSERQAAAPASPDLVRRVVLDAAAEHPALVGFRVVALQQGVGASLVRGGWVHHGDVRRDTLANLLVDARTLAEQAAAAWHKDQAQRPITSEQASAGCPVCQALVGFLPHCRECRPNPSGAPLEAQPQAPVVDAARFRGEDLPEGWRWSEGYACRAEMLSPSESDGLRALAGFESQGRKKGMRYAFNSSMITPEVWRAVENRAMRLDLIMGVIR